MFPHPAFLVTHLYMLRVPQPVSLSLVSVLLKKQPQSGRILSSKLLSPYKLSPVLRFDLQEKLVATRDSFEAQFEWLCGFHAWKHRWVCFPCGICSFWQKLPKSLRAPHIWTSLLISLTMLKTFSYSHVLQGSLHGLTRFFRFLLQEEPLHDAEGEAPVH